MTSAATYEEFLAKKGFTAEPTGLATVPVLSPKLKEHQRLLTQWALRRGRAAIFADTGLGKGWMILEWSRCVAEHTDKPVLILAPLAVSNQFDRESIKLWGEHFEKTVPQWGMRGPAGFTICRDATDVQPGVNVTNYAKLHKFDPSVFGGIAVDESSIMKHLNSHYRKELTDSFRSTPFRLSATATPSPNDHTELGGQAEFLGICSQQEMQSTFFVHDGGRHAGLATKGSCARGLLEVGVLVGRDRQDAERLGVLRRRLCSSAASLS